MKVLKCLITACCLFFICAVAITYAAKPVAIIVGGPVLSGDEGSEIHFQGKGADPDGQGIKSYQWDFDYNAPDFTVDSKEQNPRYTYPDNGEFNVALRVIDDNGEESDLDIATITINNVAPIITWVTSPTGDECEDITVEIIASDVPADILSYSFDWNNDDIYEVMDSPNPSASHTWSDNGTYTVGVKVTDDDGGEATTKTTVKVLNVPPTIDKVTNPTGDECSEITVEVNASDCIEDTLTYSFDWDNDSVYEIENQNSPSASHTWNDNGIYTVGVKVTDDDGGQAIATTKVTVLNVPPIISEVTTPTGDECSSITIEVTAFDYCIKDILTYSFDWDNDGKYEIEKQESSSASHTWNDNGTYTVGVKVTDDDGGEATKTTTVTVSNLPPTIKPLPALTGDEGSKIKFKPTASDCKGDVLRYSFDFDDDGVYDVDSYLPYATHEWADNGTYLVRVRVKDDDDGENEITAIVTIKNVPPNIDDITISPPVLAEGKTTIVSATFTDDGISDTHTAIINWGDGIEEKISVTEQQGRGTASVSHQYADNGEYTVILTVTDDDKGSSPPKDIKVIVVNQPPVIRFLKFIPSPSNEGDTVGLTAFFSDVGISDTHTATIDWGDGHQDRNVVPYEEEGSGMVSWEHSYADNGKYTVVITVSDDGNDSDIQTQEMTVYNRPPAIKAIDIAPPSPNEGELVRLRADFVDSGMKDTHTATIDWGDGSTPDVGVVIEKNGAGHLDGQHVYVNDGAYTIMVTVTDKDGDNISQNQTVTVNNVPPVVDAGSDIIVEEDNPSVDIIASFTDAGVEDTHTATINWGDGIPAAEGNLIESNGAGTVTGSHVYAADNGAYTVTVIVTDDGGNIGQDTLHVTVKNVAPTVTRVTKPTGDECNSITVEIIASDVPADILSYSFDWDNDGIYEIENQRSSSASYTWNDNDIYKVRVRVKDDDGGETTATTDVTVVNVNPTISSVTRPTGDEGSSIAIEIYSNDCSGDTLTYSFDWNNDGIYEVMDSPNPSGSHTWNDNGTYTVGVKVTDDDAGEATTKTTIKVLNVPPIIDKVTSPTGDECSSIKVDVTASDCSGDTLTYSFDWDNDGKYEIEKRKSSFASHTWNDNGIYTVGVKVTDDDGGEATKTTTVKVLNVPPIIDKVTSPTGDECSSIKVDVTASDCSGDTLTYSFDWDNDGTYEIENPKSPSASHAWNDNGIYTVGVKVTDDDDGEATKTTTVTVSNLPPTILQVTSPTGDECSSIKVDVTASDCIEDTLTYSFDWNNDGIYEVVDGPNASASYTWTDNGIYTVGVKVMDDDGDEATGTTTVTVLNLPPKIDKVTSPTGNECSSIKVEVKASDCSGDTLTYSFDWDNDGTYEIVDPKNSSANHTWTDNGIYTVRVRVKDDDGDEATATTNVTVVNVNPTIDSVTAEPGPEGDSITVEIYSNDCSGDTLTYSFDWNNDGVYDIIDIYTPSAKHIFYDNGEYTVRVRVKDDDGDFDIQTTTVTILNVAPTIDSVTNLPSVIYEGNDATVTAHFTDAGIYDTHTATIDWGDGSSIDTKVAVTEKQGSDSASGSHQYADNGNYTAIVTVTDKDGSTDQEEHQVNVRNQPPVIGLVSIAPSPANEGESVSITAAFTDAGTADTHTATVDWDDGNIDENIQPEEKDASGTVFASHKYADDDTYIVTLTVTDDDEDSAYSKKTISVRNLPPVIKSIEIKAPYDIPRQGDTVILTCLFTDEGVADTHTATINWGDGSELEKGLVVEADGSGKVTGEHVYSHDVDYTITVTVTDDDNGDISQDLPMTVQNQKPIIEPISIALSPPREKPNEGDTISITADFIDADIWDTHTATIDWNDSGKPEKGIMIEEKGSGKVSGSHQYADDGVYTIALTITDDGGEQETEPIEVLVDNAPPRNVRVEASQLIVNVGAEVTFTGSFTDPGSNDTHTYEWNFGDGTLKQGALQESHIYSKTGTFNVILTVKDDDGGEGKSKPLTVTVQKISKLEIIQLEPSVSEISENNQTLTITMKVKNSGQATATQVTPSLTSSLPEVDSRLTASKALWPDKAGEISVGKDAEFEWTFTTKVGDAEELRELVFTGVVRYKDGEISASASSVIIQRMPVVTTQIQSKKNGGTATVIGINQKFNVILNITNGGNTTAQITPTKDDLNLPDYKVTPAAPIEISGGTKASLSYEVETVEGQTESDYGKKIKINSEKLNIIEVDTGKSITSFEVTPSAPIDVDMERPKLIAAEYRDDNNDLLISGGDTLRLTFDEEVNLSGNVSAEDFILTKEPDSSVKGSLGDNFSVTSEGRVITITLGDALRLFFENDISTNIGITKDSANIVDFAGNSPDDTFVSISFKDKQSPTVVPPSLPFQNKVTSNRPTFTIWVTDQSNGPFSGLNLSEETIEVKFYKDSMEIHQKAELKVGEKKLIFDGNREYTSIDITFSQPLSSGSYTLTVIVRDKQGNPSETVVDFTVEPPSTKEKPNPIVGLTNAPNPFRSGGSTTFVFSLNGEDGIAFDVTLIIYDAAGRPVKRIRQHNMSTDSSRPYYKIYWDGRAENGAPLAGGIYLCRMTVNYNGNEYRRHAKIAILPGK